LLGSGVGGAELSDGNLRLNCQVSFSNKEMGVVTVGELKPSISGKRAFRPSSSIRHATEW
jgi:hypothetical protein